MNRIWKKSCKYTPQTMKWILNSFFMKRNSFCCLKCLHVGVILRCSISLVLSFRMHANWFRKNECIFDYYCFRFVKIVISLNTACKLEDVWARYWTFFKCVFSSRERMHVYSLFMFWLPIVRTWFKNRINKSDRNEKIIALY